jgi:hypothetical protein
MAALWAEENVFSKVIPQPETFSEEDLADLSRSSPFPSPHITAENAWWWWRNKNWGIKWDVEEADIDERGDETVITFATPWSLPTAGLQKLSALCPDLHFALICCEPGWHYAAETTFLAGEVVSDNYYQGGEEYRRIAAELGFQDEEEDDDEKEEVKASNWQREGF